MTVARKSVPRTATESWLRAPTGAARALFSLVTRLSFSQQFILFSLVILIVGAFVIGRWVAREIEKGVINRTAAVTALYVDSFVSPHLQELNDQDTISPRHLADLNQLLSTTALGQKIVSFKIWTPEGRVLYASDRALVGRVFEVGPGLRAALGGGVSSHVSSLKDEENAIERRQWSRLVETYAPIRSHDTNQVIGVSEFYQSPADLQAEVQGSQRKGWLIVSLSTFAMYVLLVGLVMRASGTITSQNRRLRDLLKRNAALSERVQRAAARKAQTDEQAMMRIGHELHDGPAQDLGLALLRLDALQGDLPRPKAGGLSDGRVHGDFQVVREALGRSLREIRDIASGLRLPELDSLACAQVVERAVQEHRQKAGAALELELGDLPAASGPAQKIALYRVAKECLNNSQRHSGVNEARVSLTAEGGILVLEVSDRGSGFDVEAADIQSSLGLRGMRERVELLGGTFSVESKPGAGTRVTARIPLSEEGG